MEEQIERDGCAEDFGKVAGNNGDFTEEPEGEVDRPGVGFATRLGEVAAGDDSEAGAERLEQDRHEVGHDENPEQAVAEACTAIEIGSPVAGVHVTDADEVGRATEGKDTAENGRVIGEDARVNVGERTRKQIGGLQFLDLFFAAAAGRRRAGSRRSSSRVAA